MQLQCRPACWIGYSGGLDSTVLLHLLSRLHAAGECAGLHAVHVNHRLAEQAGDWAAHCRRSCAALEVPFTCLQVSVARDSGMGMEAAAREARYQALASALPGHASLVLAHHQGDQAETVLLRLLRGAGPAGLAAMQASTHHHGLHLLRPLLDVEREQLTDYARAQGLTWIEDDSNADLGLDRNFLRHEILSRLQSRWPHASAALAASARLCAEADLLARTELDELLAGQLGVPRLPLARLAAHAAPARAALLRHWLGSLGLPLPGRALLKTIERELLAAGPDANPCIACGPAELRRYDASLHVLRPGIDRFSGGSLHWRGEACLELPGNGLLHVRETVGAGISRARLGGAVVKVGYRQGGERLRPAGRQGRHPLKKLLQELRVAPWLRGRLPILLADNEPVAVAGMFVCEGWQAGDGEPGLVPEWSWSAYFGDALVE